MRAAAVCVFLATIAIAAVFGQASPASAHADLISTDPAAGVSLDALPAEITFTFTQAPLPGVGITVIQVTDAAGRSLTQGRPRVDGTVVTQRLAGPASGPIEVLYKVVTPDGPPTSGEFSFTVAGVAPTPSPTPTATLPAATPSPAPTAPAPWEPTPAPVNASAGDIIPLIALLTALMAALVGAVVVLLHALRGVRGDHADDDGSGPAA